MTASVGRVGKLTRLLFTLSRIAMMKPLKRHRPAGAASLAPGYLKELHQIILSRHVGQRVPRQCSPAPASSCTWGHLSKEQQPGKEVPGALAWLGSCQPQQLAAAVVSSALS